MRLRMPMQHQIRKYEIDAVIRNRQSPASPATRCDARAAQPAAGPCAASDPRARRVQHALGNVETDPIGARVLRSTTAPASRPARNPNPECGAARAGCTAVARSVADPLPAAMRLVRRNVQREHQTDGARWRRAPEFAAARPSSALVRRILDRAASSIEYMQLSSVGPMLRSLAHRLLPTRCVVCGLQPGAPSASICAALRSRLFCPRNRALRALRDSPSERQIGRAAHLRALPGRYAALRYNDDAGRLCFAVDGMVMALKFTARLDLALIFWATVGEAVDQHHRLSQQIASSSRCRSRSSACGSADSINRTI